MPKAPSASPWNGGATTQGNELTRDYFRVESREGVRSGSIAKGFYSRADRPARRCSQWYLHGLFALSANANVLAYAELAVTTQFLVSSRRFPAEGTGHASQSFSASPGSASPTATRVAGVVRAHVQAKELNKQIRELNIAAWNERIGFKLAVGARLVFTDGTPDIWPIRRIAPPGAA